MATLATGQLIAQEKMGRPFGPLGFFNPLGTDWWVDSTNGRDGNTGCDPRHALQTLTRAVALAAIGDNIHLNPGGGETVTAQISLAVSGLRVVCPVNNPEDGFLLQTAADIDPLAINAANVLVHGLRIKHTSTSTNRSGILVNGGDGATAGQLAYRPTIRKCILNDAGADGMTDYGVKLVGCCYGALIEDNIFRGCKYGVYFADHASDTTVNSLNTVRGNLFLNGKTNYFSIYQDGTIQQNGHDIYENTFKEASGPGTAATNAWNGTTGTDATSGPIKVAATADQWTLHDNGYSCTPATSMDLIGFFTSGSSVKLWNNMLQGGGEVEAKVESVGTQVSTVDSKATSDGVLVSVVDSKLVLTDSKVVSNSVLISTASSKGTSNGLLISTADSKVVSVSVLVSTADSKLVLTDSKVVSDGVLVSTAISQATSNGVLISTTDSKLVVTDSKVVSDGVLVSTAISQATSNGVLISTADSKLVVTDSKVVSDGVLVSTAISQATSNGVLISTADSKLVVTDSKVVSNGLLVSTADSKVVSVAVLVSTADSKLVVTDSKVVSNGLLVSTADSKVVSVAVLVSTADSKLVVTDSKVVSNGVLVSTADSKVVSVSVLVSTADSKIVLVDTKVDAAGRGRGKTVVIADNALTNNTQTAPGLLVTATTGDVLIEEITVGKDGTSLAGAGMINVEFTTDNTYGPTGVDGPVAAVATATVTANTRQKGTSFAATVLVPFILESGKKLYVHGDAAAGTSAGNIKIGVSGRGMAAGAYLA